MFHLLIFGNVSIKNPKIHEIQKSVNSKNPWNPEIRETFKSRCHKFPGSKYYPEIHETLKSRCQVWGSDILPGSYIFQEVKFYREVTMKSTLRKSYALAWATNDEMTTDDGRRTTGDGVKCSPRPVGFAAGKKLSYKAIVILSGEPCTQPDRSPCTT